MIALKIENQPSHLERAWARSNCIISLQKPPSFNVMLTWSCHHPRHQKTSRTAWARGCAVRPNLNAVRHANSFREQNIKRDCMSGNPLTTHSTSHHCFSMEWVLACWDHQPLRHNALSNARDSQSVYALISWKSKTWYLAPTDYVTCIRGVCEQNYNMCTANHCQGFQPFRH